nr:efflux RND transporter periplasmic adaptor subunit [Syntrophales bacterium]
MGFVKVPPTLSEEGLITTIRAERQKVAVPVALTGEVRFDERRVGHVSTQVEGIIQQVHVSLGDPVKKGQPLLEVESVAVGEGQASYREAEVLLTLARSNFERVS